MDHPVERRDFPIGVRQDREVHLRLLGVFDVADPALVRRDVVDAHGEHLAVALLELRADLRDPAELRRAHRSEVLRMREQHAPVFTDPLVEAYRSFAGLRGEVRRDVAKLERHWVPPCEGGWVGAMRSSGREKRQWGSALPLAARFGLHTPGMRGALPTVLLVAATARAAAPVPELRFVRDGREVRRIDLPTLRRGCDERTIQIDDPYYQARKSFRALPLAEVLKLGF